MIHSKENQLQYDLHGALLKEVGPHRSTHREQKSHWCLPLGLSEGSSCFKYLNYRGIPCRLSHQSQLATGWLRQELRAKNGKVLPDEVFRPCSLPASLPPPPERALGKHGICPLLRYSSQSQATGNRHHQKDSLVSAGFGSYPVSACPKHLLKRAGDAYSYYLPSPLCSGMSQSCLQLQ